MVSSRYSEMYEKYSIAWEAMMRTLVKKKKQRATSKVAREKLSSH